MGRRRPRPGPRSEPDAGPHPATADASPRSGRGRADLDVPQARAAAADLLSRRAWTRAELARRLVRRGAPPEVAATVVADLAGRGYLDDAAFARHWVEARAGRGYGPARLRAELRARGVEPALIEAALARLPAADPLEQARSLARRRLAALGRGRPDRLAPRLRDLLLRRGFPPDTVERVVRETVGEAGGPEGA
jgi:regulatory protein